MYFSDQEMTPEAFMNSSAVKKLPAYFSLWVSGLSPFTTHRDLLSTLQQYGGVLHIELLTESLASGTRTYGHVTMFTVDQAHVCVQKLNNTMINRSPVVVSIIQTQDYTSLGCRKILK